MFKKLTSIILCALLASTTVVSAFATEQTGNGINTFYSPYSMYHADKITHPEAGTMTNDGIVDYLGNGVLTDTPTEDSKGDRAQSYSWSAIGYGDYMYIGTCAGAMTQTLSFMGSVLGHNFDQETMTATLDAMFNGSFYSREEDGGDPKGVLLKLNTKTGEVKLIMSKATTATNCNLRNAVEFNGYLYFCGSVNGIPSVYKIDPNTDEFECVYQSLSLGDFALAHKEGISVGVRGMCVFNDQLVVSMVGLEGAYICATSTPWDKDSFKVVADMEDLFNYPAYRYYDSIYGGSVWDMVEYNDALYVSLCTGTPDNKPDDNSMQSFALVRADVDENGEWVWTSVVGDTETHGSKYTYGINPNRTRSGAANLYVFDDYLYIGEYNDEQIALEDILFSRNCDFVNANLEQSVNLYRMDKNEDVELVVGDADEMFPEGSLTGIGSGFDRHENQYIWRMQEFNGKLYIGTFDTSSLLQPIGQFTNGDLLKMSKEEWKSQINYLKELIAIIKSKQETPAEPTALADLDSRLTTEQKVEMISVVNNDDVIESVDDATLEEAEKIAEALKELASQLNGDMSEDFVADYSEILAALEELKAELPPEMLVSFQCLVSSENLYNMGTILKCAGYLARAERGFDLYTLDSELNVETITIDGFGDPYNHGCRVFAVTNNGLSIGTANPFYGTQVWNLYEDNYLKYDINLDGVEDVNDVTYLQMALAGYFDLPDDFESYADVNYDGVVDVSDVTETQMYLAGYDL
ncbi:MAG: hypothetical protein UH080_04955 [Ruminococcus sp.]|nr:hypothetical protein [Ruminococcus sp.]